jgi:16S rRNA (adenine1518-N6/adenine1519-N6)-dimethyltransferase
MFQKKSLGQNFLTSTKIVDDIVVASGVTKNETVVEVGPGRGTLTSALLARGAQVVAVEKDDRLIPELQEKYPSEIKSGQLVLVHGDIMETSLGKIVTQPYRLIANIPYYITGQLIRLFLETNYNPTNMTLLVQKEVADRIIARDHKESLLSLSIKAYGTPTYVRTVGRGSFSPAPTVDSAVIHIDSISKQKFGNISEKEFFEILHTGFAHKRKQLVSNLSSLYPRETIIHACEELGLDQKCRAEDIDVNTWFTLCTLLNKKTP